VNLGHDIQSPETLQFAYKIIGQVAEQLLGTRARLLGFGAGLLRQPFGHGARAAN